MNALQLKGAIQRAIEFAVREYPGDVEMRHRAFAAYLAGSIEDGEPTLSKRLAELTTVVVK